MQDPNARSDAKQLRDDYELMLRDIIVCGIADGTFRPVDSVVTGRAILSMLNWMVRWYQRDEPRSAQTFAAEYFDLLIPGLLLHPEQHSTNPLQRSTARNTP